MSTGSKVDKKCTCTCEECTVQGKTETFQGSNQWSYITVAISTGYIHACTCTCIYAYKSLV